MHLGIQMYDRLSRINGRTAAKGEHCIRFESIQLIQSLLYHRHVRIRNYVCKNIVFHTHLG